MKAPATQDAPETAAAPVPERTRSGPTYRPATDIYETPDAIVLVADMPGVGTEGVTVQLEGGTLTVSGTPGPGAAPQGEALGAEYLPGGYHRAFSLSDAIERGGIRASIRNGVLTVVCPKAAPAQARKIEVKAG
jgi:HSP20 family protein